MGDAIRVLAYTGIRWGEMAALEVGSIDLVRRRASIYRTVVDTKGCLDSNNPKGVPVPKGTALRVGNARPTWWNTAVIEAELPTGFHPNELRHTAASLAKVPGADVKVVHQSSDTSRRR